MSFSIVLRDNKGRFTSKGVAVNAMGMFILGSVGNILISKAMDITVNWLADKAIQKQKTDQAGLQSIVRNQSAN